METVLENSSVYQSVALVKDNHFDVNLISQYRLQVVLGSREVVVCVLDSEKEKIAFFEVIEFPYLEDVESVVEVLQKIWDSHPYLLAGYWSKVELSVFDSKFCLVPEKFHNKNAVDQYYCLNHDFESNQEQLHFSESSLHKVYVYFAVNNYLLAWIKNVYQNSHIALYNHNLNIISSSSQTENSDNEQLIIFAMKGRFSFLRLTFQQIFYINCFDFNSANDFVYYVLFVINELGLNPADVEVKVWGTLSSDSGELRQLAAYLGKVEMGRKVCNHKLSYLFDELPESYFFGLHNL